MAGDISNHIISDIAGFEPLSPIVPNPHSIIPGSAFSPFPYRHHAHHHGSLPTDIQHLIAADDTENDKLRMQSTIQVQSTKIAELQESLHELDFLRRAVESKDNELITLRTENKTLLKKTNDFTLKISRLTEEKLDLESKVDNAMRQQDFVVAKLNTQIEALETRMKITLQAELDTRIRCEQLDKEFKSKEQQMANKIKALEKETRNFQIQNVELSHAKSHPQFSLPDTANLPIVIELTKEVELWKEAARKARETQSELDKTKFALEQSEAKLQQHLQSSGAAEIQDLKLKVAALRSDLKVYQEQERKFKHAQEEARELREAAKNSELLQEKIQAYKAKAERSEEHFQRATLLQAELDALRAEKTKWENFQGGVAGFQSPQHMAQTLGDYQVKESLLFSQNGELNAKVLLLETTQKHDRQKIEEMKSEIETLKKTNLENDEALKIREKQISNLSRDRDRYSRLLDSYTDATAPNGELQKQRISELEKSVAERDSLIKSLEDKVAPSQQPTTITKLTQELQFLKTENSQLSKEVEQNATYISSMEARLGQGEFDPTKAKILHFTNNPEKMKYTAELEALKAELTTIKTQLEKQQKIEKQLQLQLQQAQSNPNTSQQPLPSEVTELQQKLFDSEKMNTRLKSVFKTKIDGIKDVIAQLLGYKFEVNRDQYTLTSTFAEHPESESFVFRPEGAKMVLVESEYTKQWEKDIDVYLHKCKSIPAFLSTLTLDYFNRQTYAG